MQPWSLLVLIRRFIDLSDTYSLAYDYFMPSAMSGELRSDLPALFPRAKRRFASRGAGFLTIPALLRGYSSVATGSVRRGLSRSLVDRFEFG
jgi:hypothetical protein